MTAMDDATQAAIVAKFYDLAARDTTTLATRTRHVDPGFYTSDEQFERENDILFRRGVVFVATTADVAEPGQYLTTESGGVPLVVVRRADGEVAAYVNICRHRGLPVAAGCGTARHRFVCNFHHWAYAVDDGHLLAQPRSYGGFDAEPPDALGLRPVPVAEAHGLIAVRPVGDEPIDIDGELCGLGAPIGQFGLGDHHVHSRDTTEWNCNWKLLVDTFLESYHVFALHRASLGDQPGHRMYFEAFGPHLRVPVPGPTLYEQTDVAPADRRLVGHATVQHHLSPNVMVNHVFDYLLMWRFVPLAPDRTRAELTRYWPEPVDDTVKARLDRRFSWQYRLTAEEDYPASERIHHALQSGQVERTVLGRNEAAVIAFHETIERRLAEDSA